jgi:hypothetical protein
MEPNNHNGTELNNVQETWNQNERLRANEETGETNNNTAEDAAPETELDRIVKEEASEYDNENKENRLLGGDRASVNDLEDNE